jgi:hypothetical protein
MSDADKLAYLDSLPSKRRPSKRVVLAVAGAVVVVAVLAVLSTFRNPVVGRANVLGLCLEVRGEDVARDDKGLPLARVLVAAPDSAEVEVLMPPPVPRPGDFLPLVIDEHKKGNKSYAVDAGRWAAEGPS